MGKDFRPLKYYPEFGKYYVNISNEQGANDRFDQLNNKIIELTEYIEHLEKQIKTLDQKITEIDLVAGPSYIAAKSRFEQNK